MNLDTVLAMRDSDELKAAIKRAGEQRQSSADLLAQRVSFVFASVSEKGGVTKDQVRKAILEQASGTTAAA